ncbi:HNH endonuclease [uncultured Pontibacter sp.]|uniref:HNH endonuclease n=1 Tax=uncultured Pontibacter sp. TaxID=453356 RepID=UPI0026150269|nr:HNH endonuclease [uncultured Pontibacter sp.]
MATELSVLQWTEILQNSELTKEIDLKILQTLYGFPNHKAFASEIGKILGYKKSPQSPLNSEVGFFAKRIAKVYDIGFTARNQQQFKYWDLFFLGEPSGTKFYWILKPNLREALESTALTGDELLPEELPTNTAEIFFEGLKRTITVNAYERNTKAKEQCKSHWGHKCAVCTFDFRRTYGEIGKEFIHVHHLTPIAQVGERYEIDPIEDLIPVCPNCHSMLHRKDPPYTIKELRSIIEEQVKEKTPTTNIV